MENETEETRTLPAEDSFSENDLATVQTLFTRHVLNATKSLTTMRAYGCGLNRVNLSENNVVNDIRNERCDNPEDVFALYVYNYERIIESFSFDHYRTKGAIEYVHTFDCRCDDMTHVKGCKRVFTISMLPSITPTA